MYNLASYEMRTLIRSLTFEFSSFDNSTCQREFKLNLKRVEDSCQKFVDCFDKTNYERYLDATEKMQGFELILIDNLGNFLKKKFIFS